MTPDTAALQEPIAQRLMGALDPHSEIIAVHEGCGAEVVTHARQSVVVAAVLPIVEAELRAAKAEALTKRWVCQVARSGYHNGASCRPDEAHNDWGCDYYYEASIRATEYETGDLT